MIDIPDPGAFAGYYAELLPERCWDSMGRKVVSDENWGSLKVVMCADVDHKKVTKITFVPDEPGAWSVLDVSDNVVVAGYSSPTSAPQLVRLHEQICKAVLPIVCTPSVYTYQVCKNTVDSYISICVIPTM